MLVLLLFIVGISLGLVYLLYTGVDIIALVVVGLVLFPSVLLVGLTFVHIVYNLTARGWTTLIIATIPTGGFILYMLWQQLQMVRDHKAYEEFKKSKQK